MEILQCLHLDYIKLSTIFFHLRRGIFHFFLPYSLASSLSLLPHSAATPSLNAEPRGMVGHWEGKPGFVWELSDKKLFIKNVSTFPHPPGNRVHQLAMVFPNALSKSMSILRSTGWVTTFWPLSIQGALVWGTVMASEISTLGRNIQMILLLQSFHKRKLWPIHEVYELEAIPGP